MRPYYKSDLIKSIAGIRRCGKSTILKQIIEELSERVSDDQIIFYDFEDFDNEHYLHDPQGFYHDVKNRIAALAGKKAYILIDEVQYMDRYIPIIASIRSALGASVFVTGSTSTLPLYQESWQTSLQDVTWSSRFSLSPMMRLSSSPAMTTKRLSLITSNGEVSLCASLLQ